MAKGFRKKYSISDELKERTFNFAMSVLELDAKLPNTEEASIVRRQLCKSGTSVGANVEESDGSLTLNDFVYRVDVAFKEVKETRYWLRVIVARKMLKMTIIQPHLDESLELVKILSTIIYKCLK
jgi:four helix bundle protein